MASFSLRWRRSTRKDLRKLPPREVQRIVAEVESLGEEPFPHGSEKLAGAEHAYRIRLGDYRVVYQVVAFRAFHGDFPQTDSCGTGE